MRLTRNVLLVGALALVALVGFSAAAGGSASAGTPGVQRFLWGAWIGKQFTGTEAPWSWQAVKDFEAKNAGGRHMSIVHWGVGTPWDHNFNWWLSPLNRVRNAGRLSLVDAVTGSVPLRQIANGAYDTAFRTWAIQAKLWGHPFLLRFDFEMNGGWEPWGTRPFNRSTPADFVAAWRHVHDIFTAAGATNVGWVWCPNTNAPHHKMTSFASLYPGDSYVDWTCLDGYNMGGSSQSFSSLYSQSYNDLLKIAPTKPVMVGEVASLEYAAGAKATWITDLLTELPTSFPQIKALVWFNWRNDHNGTWESNEVESSPTSQAAFATGIASPYYAAASSFTMPAQLTKIQPLP